MNTTVSQSKSHVKICLTLILVSLLLVLTDVKVVPGGPFLSIHAEIVPVLCCLAALLFIASDFRAASIGRRVGLSFLALVSTGIIVLVLRIVISFCLDRFSRGAIIGL
jgi:hypothetical protein